MTDTTKEEQEAIQRDVQKLVAISADLNNLTEHYPALSRAMWTTVSNAMEEIAEEGLHLILRGEMGSLAHHQTGATTGLVEWGVMLGMAIERAGGLEVICNATDNFEIHDPYHGWESDEHRAVHNGKHETTDLGKARVPNPNPFEADSEGYDGQ